MREIVGVVQTTAQPRFYATTLAGVVALLGMVALIAFWIPARWAARTDPMETLRVE